ncbi:MAG: aminoglycoside phosphotransferase family protein [Thermoplasmataceae archaeon]|jgi:aminoglycoside 2''-phosphotransferase
MHLNDNASQIKRRFLPAINSVLPGTKFRSLRFIKEGWDNYVLLAEERTIFRFPRFQGDWEKLHNEASLLNRISEYLPVRVPDAKFENLRTGNHYIRFSHYPVIPGKALRYGSLKFTNQESLAVDLSNFLKVLHSLDMDRLDNLKVRRMDRKVTERRYSEILKDFDQNIFPLLDALSVARLESGFHDFFSGLDTMPDPVLIHGDIGQGNVLYDRYSSRITGIIDWEDSLIADPAFDLAGVLEYFHDNFFRRVLSAYMNLTDKGFLQRVMFYSQISGYYAFVYGRMIGNRDMEAAGLRSLSSHRRIRIF